MKVKYLGAMLFAAALTFFGCDDNTGTLGMNMLPGSDGITAHTTTFDVMTRSIKADSVFARTSTGYVGRFSDPDFGYYEASFLTELNCLEDYGFPEVYDPEKKTGVLTGDSVTDIRLVVFYSSWFGDSLNASRMSIYELDKKLERNRYTNIDPEEYYNKYDPNALLGRKAYTAYDTAIPDSIRKGKDENGNPLYSPHVAFTLDKEYGNWLLETYRKHPEYFKNSEAFIDNIFKGLYIKNDYGDGTILYVDQVVMQMQYSIYILNDTTKVPYKRKHKDHIGEDSTGVSWRTQFASTKEVIQANRFLNSTKLDERIQETEHTYIKSPAGIFTEAVLPYDSIYNELTGDTLNSVKLTFTNFNQENKYEFSMSAPQSVLLLRKKDFKTFFEENDLPDNVTSYAATHNNVATNQYTFSNIARLVSACISEKKTAKDKARQEAGSNWNETAWEEKWNTDDATKDWDKVLLIPVSITYDYSNQTPTMTDIQNDLQPGYAKLKGGPAEIGGKLKTPLKLEVTYTTFNE